MKKFYRWNLKKKISGTNYLISHQVMRDKLFHLTSSADPEQIKSLREVTVYFRLSNLLTGNVYNAPDNLLRNRMKMLLMARVYDE